MSEVESELKDMSDICTGFDATILTGTSHVNVSTWIFFGTTSWFVNCRLSLSPSKLLLSGCRVSILSSVVDVVNSQ